MLQIPINDKLVYDVTCDVGRQLEIWNISYFLRPNTVILFHKGVIFY